MTEHAVLPTQPAAIIDAKSMRPSLATELGYQLHIAHTEPADSIIRQEAAQFIKDFNAVVEFFRPETPAGWYLREIRLYATGLARGISSRRAIRERKLHAAEEQWNLMRSQIVSNEHWSGVMRGAWQILLLGGFVFVVIRVITQQLLGMPGFAEHAAKNVSMASLTTTLGICLLNSYYKAWSTKRAIERLGREYRDRIAHAEYDYTTSARIEYALCAEQASAAWTEFTGERPPMETVAFNKLIQGLISRREYVRGLESGKPIFIVRAARIFARQLTRKRNGRPAADDLEIVD
ncbi:MAG: hypothetical protein HY006_00080 [Candidatus Sungbacteria bacterium]|nr:hypothetical protein [Candidatus Sungbacteria bacterium]